MTDDEREANRLAEQRLADLVVGAQREAEYTVFQAETRARLTQIDKFIVKAEAQLETLVSRDAVNAALVDATASAGAKRLTRLQTAFMVLAGIVAVVSLLVAVAQAVA